MEKLLKNGCSGVIVRIYSMEMKQEDENILDNLKCTLEKHHRVFQEILKGFPSPRSTSPNKRTCIYPNKWKGDIKKNGTIYVGCMHYSTKQEFLFSIDSDDKKKR